MIDLLANEGDSQEVNLPLQIQPQIFGFFSLVSWGQILYYNQYVVLVSFAIAAEMGFGL